MITELRCTILIPRSSSFCLFSGCFRHRRFGTLGSKTGGSGVKTGAELGPGCLTSWEKSAVCLKLLSETVLQLVVSCYLPLPLVIQVWQIKNLKNINQRKTGCLMALFWSETVYIGRLESVSTSRCPACTACGHLDCRRWGPAWNARCWKQLFIRSMRSLLKLLLVRTYVEQINDQALQTTDNY